MVWVVLELYVKWGRTCVGWGGTLHGVVGHCLYRVKYCVGWGGTVLWDRVEYCVGWDCTLSGVGWMEHVQGGMEHV